MSTQRIITDAVARLGDAALTERAVVEHLHPLFSRVLARNARTSEIYLANHSLGRPLDAAADDVAEFMDAWYADMDGAWDQWIAERESYRARIASLIGCSRPDAVVPKSSAAQGLRAVMHAIQNPKPRIVATSGEFDSIDFNLKAAAHKQRAEVRWVGADEQGQFQSEDLIAEISGGADLVVLSMALFVTGQLIDDLSDVIRAAHEYGALVLLDAYHTFGVMPIGFESLGADFLIAGNYKYTRGGPGACFLAIHPKHLSTTGGVPKQDALFTTDTGWFAKQDTFAYRRTEDPEFEAGGDAWLESTPPAILYYQARSGLILTEAIGLDRLRAYSLHQQSVLTELLEEQRIRTSTPDRHGAFVLVSVNDGHACMRAIRDAGVNIDGRPSPTTDAFYIRLCPDLLTTESEMRQAASRIARVIRPYLAH
jgi:kynureninase